MPIYVSRSLLYADDRLLPPSARNDQRSKQWVRSMSCDNLFLGLGSLSLPQDGPANAQVNGMFIQVWINWSCCTWRGTLWHMLRSTGWTSCRGPPLPC